MPRAQVPQPPQGFLAGAGLRNAPRAMLFDHGETPPEGPIVTAVVGEMLGKRRSRLVNRPSNELLLPDTNLGYEIEIEGVPFRTLGTTLPEDIRQYFEWHQDQSLHDAGCEFTFRDPMYGEDVVAALKAFFRYAPTTPWRISSRCGIHVHVDARDLTHHMLLGMVAYYIMFEPALYAWAGEDRHANNFCVPWYKAEGSVMHAIKILDSMRKAAIGELNPRQVLSACEQFYKYPGLNMKALHAYGSLEFRQLATSLDYQRSLDWINIILALKKAAHDVPDSTMTIVHDLNRFGVERTGQRIFGDRIWREMLAGNPELMDEINEWALPNAIEFIQAVIDKPLGKQAKLEWPTATKTVEEEKKEDHPGFLAWRKANYPKDQQNDEETTQPQQTIGDIEHFLSRIFISDINLNEERPPRVPVDERLPDMASRGYLLNRREEVWVYLQPDRDTGRVRLRATAALDTQWFNA